RGVVFRTPRDRHLHSALGDQRLTGTQLQREVPAKLCGRTGFRRLVKVRAHEPVHRVPGGHGFPPRIVRTGSYLQVTLVDWSSDGDVGRMSPVADQDDSPHGQYQDTGTKNPPP